MRVNTRRPIDHNGEMRYQAETAIEDLRNAGVKVCVYDDMRHRKLAIVDGRILWEGSLNTLSNGGCSCEIMRRQFRDSYVESRLVLLTSPSNQ